MAAPSSPKVYTPAVVREIAAGRLKHVTQRFEETGLAVYAWDAIAECLTVGLPLPGSVHRYLTTAAIDITRLSRDRYPTKGNIDRSVAKALRLNGRAKFNPFSYPRQVSHEISVALDVYDAHTRMWFAQRDGLGSTHDWTSVFKEVAAQHRCDLCGKKKLSVATVKRYWYRNARTVIPPRLFKQSQSQKIDDVLR